MMHLEIIAPDRLIYDGEVEVTTLPGSKGAFQVLPDHAAIISSLTQGKIQYRLRGREHELMIRGGVAEVLNNRITVLVEEVLGEPK
jgi:F-type H+-transporting ATPase subunit epsilon